MTKETKTAFELGRILDEETKLLELTMGQLEAAWQRYEILRELYEIATGMGKEVVEDMVRAILKSKDIPENEGLRIGK